jgi:energy-coupling factor transporter ATP-binding protein EcfA2
VHRAPIRGPGPEARPELEFRTDSTPSARDAASELRRARIGAAVRAAHGAGVQFECRISSGDRAVLRLRLDSRAAVRWWSRFLRPAAEPGRWAPNRNPPDPSLRPTPWYATPLRPWPSPLGSRADPVPWLAGMVAQLQLSPEGVELGCAFHPAPLPHPAPSAPACDADHGTWRSGDGSHRAQSPPPARAVDSADLGPVWWCRCVLRADGRIHRGGSVREIARALESATRSANGNGLRFRVYHGPFVDAATRFPIAENDLRDVFVGGDLLAAPPRPESSREVLVVGRRSDGRTVGVPVEEGQGRHLLVLGETGMGKSSLLTAIARSASARDGVVLLDPLGETARAVRDALSSAVGRRLLWIDPGATRGCNALATLDTGPTSPRAERTLNDLVHALRRVREGRFPEGGFWGPRLEEMLARAVRAAAALPGGTLEDAHALLAAEGRGFRQVPPEALEPVRALADRIRARPEDADGARRLLFEVVRNPTLNRLLCAREPGFLGSDLVAPGRVVLLAGDARSVGESTARYLLSVFLALVWSELLARPNAPKTWVLLDEAHWFAHESLAEMLRMARRCNVHVVLATQGVGSLPGVVAEAAWTNVADFVAFRGSPADARDLARSVRGVSPESILSLGRGEALFLMGKGERVEWIRSARPVRVGARLGRHGSPPPARGGPEPPGSEETALSVPPLYPAGEARVLDALLLRTESCGSPDTLRVSLRELRDEVDPSGEAIRGLGRTLTRWGALLRTDRGSDGTWWSIDTKRLRTAAGAGWEHRRFAPEPAPPLSENEGPARGDEPSVYP